MLWEGCQITYPTLYQVIALQLKIYIYSKWSVCVWAGCGPRCCTVLQKFHIYTVRSARMSDQPRDMLRFAQQTRNVLEVGHIVLTVHAFLWHQRLQEKKRLYTNRQVVVQVERRGAHQRQPLKSSVFESVNCHSVSTEQVGPVWFITVHAAARCCTFHNLCERDAHTFSTPEYTHRYIYTWVDWHGHIHTFICKCARMWFSKSFFAPHSLSKLLHIFQQSSKNISIICPFFIFSSWCFISCLAPFKHNVFWLWGSVPQSLNKPVV